MENTSLHTDDVLDYDGTVLASLLVRAECTDGCNPGNCEVAHAQHFGYDLWHQAS